MERREEIRVVEWALIQISNIRIFLTSDTFCYESALICSFDIQNLHCVHSTSRVDSELADHSPSLDLMAVYIKEI